LFLVQQRNATAAAYIRAQRSQGVHVTQRQTLVHHHRVASKGVGVRVLAELNGHRSIATTQRYIDVNDDMLRKAVELV
jgi:site-specific recombinase XerD